MPSHFNCLYNTGAKTWCFNPWINGIIPYEIQTQDFVNDANDVPTMVRNALDDIEGKLCCNPKLAKENEMFYYCF